MPESGLECAVAWMAVQDRSGVLKKITMNY